MKRKRRQSKSQEQKKEKISEKDKKSKQKKNETKKSDPLLINKEKKIVTIHKCDAARSINITKNNLLKDLCHPININDFFENYYTKKSFCTHGSIHRFDVLSEHGLHNLNIEQLLDDTPSETIQAWIKTVDKKQLGSAQCHDAKSAYTLYQGGHSLYCRAPTELSELLISSLAHDLGMAFTSKNFENDLNGEVELFCTRKNHVTDWHFDFMENFTIQLQGSKKWILKRGSIQHCVLRGCTPHYVRQNDIVEQQLKVHRLLDPSFQYDGSSNEEEAEIILKPGSIFYFPSGMWHRVECMEDSISINLSMFLTTSCDVVLDAVRQLLWKSEKWRRGLCVPNIQQGQLQIKELLDDLGKQVQLLSAHDILPPTLLYQHLKDDEEEEDECAICDEDRHDHNKSCQSKSCTHDDDDKSSQEKHVHSHNKNCSHEHDDGSSQEEEEEEEKIINLVDIPLPKSWNLEITSVSKFKKNPLAVLMKQSEINSLSSSHPAYILNVLFGSSKTDLFQSHVRVEFSIETDLEDVLEWINVNNSSVKTQSTFSFESFAKAFEKVETDRLKELIIRLCYHGYLSPVNSE